MTLCPIAIVSGCRKCPIVSACPLKSIIGDYMPAEKSEPAHPADNEKTVKIDRDRRD